MKKQKGPTLQRWTKPGFFPRKNPKAEQFGISRKAESNIPITLNVGDVQIKWEDPEWINGRITDRSKDANPSIQDIKEMKTRNAQLQVECEILLNMLTSAELRKARLKRELAEKKIVLQELIERVEAEREENE
ncbi:hypothetical protein M9Y10_039158 [Tritrichomonas musculus]|uniref:Uncharacterized protein n=1 Tax=Tritrichomonas musculus TaxID=1915356 RepID=A0ABR2KAE4_9EUKA